MGRGAGAGWLLTQERQLTININYESKIPPEDRNDKNKTKHQSAKNPEKIHNTGPKWGKGYETMETGARHQSK